MEEREFWKGVCIVAIFGCGVAALCAWGAERPSTAVAALRYWGIAGAVLGFIGFVLLHFRRDKVPDYLYDLCPKYFDRGGFCFSVTCGVEDDKAVFEMYYQNRQNRQCEAQVVLRPRRTFFARRDPVVLAFQVNCPPAGFGVVRVPLPLPSKMQGKKVTFEVGASTHYPHGYGHTLRFRDGIVLRHNSDFKGSFFSTLQIAGLLGGALILSSPASITLPMPAGVLEEFPAEGQAQDLTLWQLGDPPLSEETYADSR